MFEPEDRAIQAERAMDRQRAMTVPCRYCTAMVGEECFNRITGEPLEKIPAHMYRLQDVGF